MAKKKQKSSIAIPKNTKKSVEINKVKNGFTISTYDQKSFNRITYIADNKEKAKNIASKILSV
jgi:hypothetical protein